MRGGVGVSPSRCPAACGHRSPWEMTTLPEVSHSSIGATDHPPQRRATRLLHRRSAVLRPRGEYAEGSASDRAPGDHNNDRHNRRRNDTKDLPPSVLAVAGSPEGSFDTCCGVSTAAPTTGCAEEMGRIVGLLLERPSLGRVPGGRESPQGEPTWRRPIGRRSRTRLGRLGQRPSTSDRTPVRCNSGTIRCSFSKAAQGRSAAPIAPRSCSSVPGSRSRRLRPGRFRPGENPRCRRRALVCEQVRARSCRFWARKSSRWSGARTSGAVAEHHPDLVMLDLQIGNMGGSAVAIDLRLEESGGWLPHVLILLLLDVGSRPVPRQARRCGRRTRKAVRPGNATPFGQADRWERKRPRPTSVTSSRDASLKEIEESVSALRRS